MDHLLFYAISVQIGVTAILLLLFVSRQHMKKQYAARMRCWIWMALALRLIFPFPLDLDKNTSPIIDVPINTVSYNIQNNKVETKKLSESTAINRVSDTDMTLTLPHPKTTIVPTVNKNNFSVNLSLIGFVWGTGTLISLAVTMISYHFTKRRILAFSASRDDLEVVVAHMKTELHVTKKVDIKFCDCITSPLLMGFVHPIIFLPIKEIDVEDLPLIIKHELIHLKRHDIFYKYINEGL